MAKERYIAALEISSSKVIGAVGIAGRSGQIEIIAVEQEKSSDTVRYGQIQNIEESYNLTNYVLERLERHPNITPREITGVYVGLSGRSLRSISVDVTLSLPDDTDISEAILERLKKKALEADIDSSLEIVDAIPRVFKVGKDEVLRPIGTMGNTISATYDLIVARPAIQSNLKRVVKDRVGLDIKGTVVTALATANVVLSEQEKNVGCMFVDIGAETSSVVIYRRGKLVYYATLPLGGRNITRDLMSLNELEEKAEEFKLNFGNAMAGSNASQEKIGKHRLSDINDLVVARSEEIVANIVEQVRYADLTDKDIPEGIILCGGGARMNGIMDLIMKFSSLKVRMATLPASIKISDPKAEGVEILEVASIMYAGSEMGNEDTVCLETPSTPQPEPKEEEPEETGRRREDEDRPASPRKNGWFKKIGSTFGRMFTPLGDDDEGEELT